MRLQILYRFIRGTTAHEHDLRISHIAIDRKHTTAEDQGTYSRSPSCASRQRGTESVARAAFSRRPDQSQHRTTLEVDCPEIVARCKADGVDAAILVPNCPVCHQSVSLAARLWRQTASRRW